MGTSVISTVVPLGNAKHVALFFDNNLISPLKPRYRGVMGTVSSPFISLRRLSTISVGL